MLKPYQQSRSSKKNQIEKMFDKISDDYDFLNWIITFNNHKRWKNNILSIAKKLNPTKALDIATGTADIAIKLGSIPKCEVVGVDISEQMLNIGRKKIRKKNLQKSVSPQNGDAENLNYAAWSEGYIKDDAGPTAAAATYEYEVNKGAKNSTSTAVKEGSDVVFTITLLLFFLLII